MEAAGSPGAQLVRPITLCLLHNKFGLHPCAKVWPMWLRARREEGLLVKVRPSVKPICEKCKVIKRRGAVMVICENPKHKQKQG